MWLGPPKYKVLVSHLLFFDFKSKFVYWCAYISGFKRHLNSLKLIISRSDIKTDIIMVIQQWISKRKTMKDFYVLKQLSWSNLFLRYKKDKNNLLPEYQWTYVTVAITKSLYRIWCLVADKNQSAYITPKIHEKSTLYSLAAFKMSKFLVCPVNVPRQKCQVDRQTCQVDRNWFWLIWWKLFCNYGNETKLSLLQLFWLAFMLNPETTIPHWLHQQKLISFN